MKTTLAIFATMLLLVLTPGSADASTGYYRNCKASKIQVSVNGSVVYRTPGKCWSSTRTTSTTPQQVGLGSFRFLNP